MVMAFTVTHVFMFTELRWNNKIYVKFYVVSSYGKWSSIAAAGSVVFVQCFLPFFHKSEDGKCLAFSRSLYQ